MLDGVANKMSNGNPDHPFAEEHKNTVQDRARIIHVVFADNARRVHHRTLSKLQRTH